MLMKLRTCVGRRRTVLPFVIPSSSSIPSISTPTIIRTIHSSRRCLKFTRPTFQFSSLYTCSLPSSSIVIEDGSADKFSQSDSMADFVRFRRGINGGSGDLQTSIVSYRKKFPWSLIYPFLQMRPEAFPLLNDGIIQSSKRNLKIEIYSRLDIVAAIKVLLAKTVVKGFTEMPADVAMKSVIIGERNKAAVDSLRKAIQEGHNRIAILYGVGHIPDLGKRLREKFELDPFKRSGLPRVPKRKEPKYKFIPISQDNGSSLGLAMGLLPDIVRAHLFICPGIGSLVMESLSFILMLIGSHKLAQNFCAILCNA